jgi:hypothetical protein
VVSFREAMGQRSSATIPAPTAAPVATVDVPFHRCGSPLLRGRVSPDNLTLKSDRTVIVAGIAIRHSWPRRSRGVGPAGQRPRQRTTARTCACRRGRRCSRDRTCRAMHSLSAARHRATSMATGSSARANCQPVAARNGVLPSDPAPSVLRRAASYGRSCLSYEDFILWPIIFDIERR